MLFCVTRCYRGARSHPWPCQADGQGGEDCWDQRWRSRFYPAGAGSHPFGQEEVSDWFSTPTQTALTGECQYSMFNGVSTTWTQMQEHKPQSILLLCVGPVYAVVKKTHLPSISHKHWSPSRTSLIIFLKFVCFFFWLDARSIQKKKKKKSVAFPKLETLSWQSCDVVWERCVAMFFSTAVESN